MDPALAIVTDTGFTAPMIKEFGCLALSHSVAGHHRTSMPIVTPAWDGVEVTEGRCGIRKIRPLQWQANQVRSQASGVPVKVLVV